MRDKHYWREKAAENGIPHENFYSRIGIGWSYEKAATKPVQKTGRKALEYAVYKGDDLLVMGTAEYCANRLGTSRDYIRWLTTPAGKRRLAQRKDPDKATTAIKLEAD